MYDIQKNRGYTLLFAVLTSSLVLAMGISILTISRKEILLSSAAQESHYAYYAADSGLECVKFWDQNIGFATSSESAVLIYDDIRCGGVPIIIDETETKVASDEAVTAFTVDSLKGGGYCAIISITKSYNSNRQAVIIDSRGYNTCDPADPRRVERAIRLEETEL
jgi:hypothetical protein